MGIGSFLAGMFLGGACSSNVVTHNHHTTVIRNPVQYPNDWDEYDSEKKLEWLKNRCYWREYYQLKDYLYEQAYKRVEFKLVEEGDNIYYKVLDSIIKNKGDKTEADQLFLEYLNKKYMTKFLNNTTRMEIKMEVDQMNDYIQNNYSSISQFYKPVEAYYFNVKIN